MSVVVAKFKKICEDAPELRDLERMLKIAYLNKERATQYEEKIALAMREQERIQAIEDEMEGERIRLMQRESNADLERKKKFVEQRAVLQGQINERRERLREAQQQIERDRATVDEIMHKIQQEDEDEFRTRREKQAATAKMVKDFEVQRQHEMEARRAAERAEEERIALYQRAMEARNEGIAAKKTSQKGGR
jgi:glycine cleavage system H lipoate-binding protein